MQLFERRPRLSVRDAIATFALGTLIFLATDLPGYDSALAAERENAPGFASSRDLSGVWRGELSENMPDGTVGHGSLYLRLRQSGDQMSGVAGDSEATLSPVENLVLSGNHLQFSVTTAGDPESRVLLKVELDVNGDAMEGKGHALRRSDNHAWNVEIKLARSK